MIKQMKIIQVKNQYVKLDDSAWLNLEENGISLTVSRRRKSEKYNVSVCFKGRKSSLASYLLRYPENCQIDHIDQNPLNNCQSNLRIVKDSRANCQNKPRNVITGLFNVTQFMSEKWGIPIYKVEILWQGKHSAYTFMDKFAAGCFADWKRRTAFPEILDTELNFPAYNFTFEQLEPFMCIKGKNEFKVGHISKTKERNHVKYRVYFYENNKKKSKSFDTLEKAKVLLENRLALELERFTLNVNKLAS